MYDTVAFGHVVKVVVVCGVSITAMRDGLCSVCSDHVGLLQPCVSALP
jgi:hypothetical protein